VRRFALLLLLALACAGPARWRGPLAEAAPVDPAVWAADAAWLSDPAREGRGLGSAGLDAAARFLAERFAAAGLEPAAPGGGFLQRFRMPVAIAIAEQRLTLGGELLAPERDFRALLASESGHFAGDLVFAGFGISDPATGWDDYARIRAEGALLLVLDGRPSGPVFDERRGAAVARRALKLATARRHGARAVLFVPTREADAAEARTDAIPTAPSAGVIALALSPAATGRVARRAGGDLDEWVRRAEAGEPLDLRRLRTTGAVEVARREGEVANVIGRLRGGDPRLAHEQIVIGAHYDHLGHGEFASLAPAARGEVHPGADDNASGAAGLIALARAFANAPRPARTLVFVAFTAEEVGLVGSARYVESLAASETGSDPKATEVTTAVDARREPEPSGFTTVAMLDLDMIGRLGEGGVSAFGADTAPAFADLVRRAAARRDLAVSFVEGSHGPSDHASFHGARIPALLLTTGVHEAYHTPDDRAEALRADGAARVLGLAADVALALADAPERPRFAEARPAAGAAALHAGGYGPWLGTVPAFGAGGPRGARIAAVVPGSPAERAGLAAGDVIVSFAGTEVASLEEFASLLFLQSEGSEVEIVVRRGDERIETRAVLGSR
jgi:hypothetical protein